jgi:DNA repair protein RecN (Recombination protein N)
MLDRYAGVEPERDELGALVREWRSIQHRINEIVRGARERAQRVDLIRFQVAEIESAGLRPGEEDQLLRERSILANAERLAQTAAEAQTLLVGGEEAFDPSAVPAVAALRQAWHLIGGLAEVDAGLRELAIRAEESLDALEAIAAEVRDYREGIEADPARLEAIEERLDVIKGLKRKYGATVEEILAYAETAAAELERLTGGDEGVEILRGRELVLAEEIGRRATSLSCRRRAAGDELADAVERAIGELNMGRARFAVAIEQVDDPNGAPFGMDGTPHRSVAIDATGADRVEFLIAANAGEALKPLGRVASGGETARLMLAMKSILSAADATPTLVFDEVDVGVGGRSGQVVGEKLAALANGHQVVVISHLPQIAAHADAHFRIAKLEADGRTVSRIERLEAAERIEELAAMLDGEPITEAARASATEMLRRARRAAGE